MRSWVKRLYCFFRSRIRPGQRRVPQDTYTKHRFAIDDLNFAAARRQASIGKHYARHTKTKTALCSRRQGTTTLPPHEPWTGDYTDWTARPCNYRNWRLQCHPRRWINPFLWAATDGDEESKSESK